MTEDFFLIGLNSEFKFQFMNLTKKKVEGLKTRSLGKQLNLEGTLLFRANNVHKSDPAKDN